MSKQSKCSIAESDIHLNKAQPSKAHQQRIIYALKTKKNFAVDKKAQHPIHKKEKHAWREEDSVGPVSRNLLSDVDTWFANTVSYLWSTTYLTV